MKLSANISIGAVCRAMGAAELDGALVKQLTVTVIYRKDDLDRVSTFRRKGGDRLLVPNAEVRASDALELLTPEDLDEAGIGCDEFTPAHDDGDLHEFIAACMNGDRHSALALVHRLFDGRNADTAERLLLASDRRMA